MQHQTYAVCNLKLSPVGGTPTGAVAVGGVSTAHKQQSNATIINAPLTLRLKYQRAINKKLILHYTPNEKIPLKKAVNNVPLMKLRVKNIRTNPKF